MVDLWGDVHNAEETLGIEDALRAMTINNADLTYSDEWNGSLEPGKVADLLVVQESPLKDINNLRKTSLVFKEGLEVLPLPPAMRR